VKKTILLLIVLVAAALATSPAVLSNAPQPPTTEELSWDDGSYRGSLRGHARGVWFTMPFAAQVITARVYIAPATDYDAPFDLLVCPRDGSGLPDDANAHGNGTLNYPGGEATDAGWLDVDISSLDINLSSGDEFYICFYPESGSGEPDCAYDFDSDDPHNAWHDGSNWNTSSNFDYMFRVIVDDGASQVELTSWGYIKSEL
jgi:hypothetical protein